MVAMRKIGLLLLMVAALFAGSGVSAGQLREVEEPYVEDPDAEWSMEAPWTAPDALVRYALYGRLADAEDVDFFSYQFEGAEDEWPLEVTVPQCGEHFAAFYPSMAVVGPGLEQPPEGVLPFDLPEGMGAQILVEEEHPEPRPAMINSHPWPLYPAANHHVDIPEAGNYLLALWEPEDDVGGYFVTTGALVQLDPDRDEEREALLKEITAGHWMGQDCSAPVLTATPELVSCPPTPGDALGPFYVPGAPERSKVGAGGYVVTGVVRDSSTCQPVPGAQVEFWQVNETGEYDDAHRATLFADKQGAYSFESNRPVGYSGRPPHIHVRVTAPGFRELVTQIYPDQLGPANNAEFALNLTPEQ
jgi:protocatechuate 3,4-dioxygenase beta subunit